MRIIIYPVACIPGQYETSASVSGDTLTVDGVDYDLNSVPEGSEAVPSGEHPFVGAITRVDGEINAAIRWRYDSATAASNQGQTPPAVSVTDGGIPDPIFRRATT